MRQGECQKCMFYAIVFFLFFFPSGTSSCLSDRLVSPKGGSVVILQEMWDQGPLRLLWQWVSEWNRDWQRETTAITIDSAKARRLGLWLLLMGPVRLRIISLQERFYLIGRQVYVFESSHDISATYNDCLCSSCGGSGMKSSSNVLESTKVLFFKILNIPFTVYFYCVFATKPGPFSEHCQLF